jgi:hypothetical protein
MLALHAAGVGNNSRRPLSLTDPYRPLPFSRYTHTYTQQDQRKATLVYYLNPGWDVQNNGGQLRLYTRSGKQVRWTMGRWVEGGGEKALSIRTLCLPS